MGGQQSMEAAKTDPAVQVILSHVDAHLEDIRADIKKQEDRTTSLMESINSYMQRQEDFAKAIPLGRDGRPDFEGHCGYHETVIDAMRQRREFWQKLTFELTKWGLIGFVGWLIVQMWLGLLHGPKG